MRFQARTLGSPLGSPSGTVAVPLKECLDALDRGYPAFIRASPNGHQLEIKRNDRGLHRIELDGQAQSYYDHGRAGWPAIVSQLLEQHDAKVSPPS